jgi:hypothetical protein
VTPLLPWNAKDGKPLEVVNNVCGDAERRRRLSEPASSSWLPKSSAQSPAGPTEAPDANLVSAISQGRPDWWLGRTQERNFMLVVRVNDGHRNGHWAVLTPLDL